MKLYTEEQLRKAINDSSLYSYVNGDFEFKNSEDDIVNSLTPIELPSDEEIEKAVNEYANVYQCPSEVKMCKHDIKSAWINAIGWYREQLKQRQ